MYLPSVRALGKTRRQIVQFGGLNYTEDTRDGELSDSRGLSCGAFPGLSQRLGRHKLQDARGVSSIYAWGKLVTVAGDRLYYDGEAKGTVTPGKKQFAVVNTKLVVFPDKKFLDLATGELMPLGARGETLDHSVRFTETELVLRGKRPVLTNMVHSKTSVGSDILTNYYYAVVIGEENVVWDGTQNNGNGVWVIGGVQAMNMLEIKAQYLAGAEVCMMTLENNEPRPIYRTTRPNAAEVWAQSINRSGRYALVTGEPSGDAVQGFEVPLEVRYAGSGSNPGMDTFGFSIGDVVTISGCKTLPENDRDVKIVAITDTSITVDSPVFTPGDEAEAVTIERRIPDLDFICESGNRLCGVSNKDKTIYVSALGDPRNICDYTGVATDSYAVVTGTDGDFTGCAAWSGSVLFFKEDCVHRLVGDFPAEYAVYVDHVAGVQKGCAGSIVLLNEVLYYKGREGIYAYTGSTPRLISGALGNVRYDSAVAGVDGSVLYFSMRRQDTMTWELLTYDTRRGLWLKEDALEAVGFAQLDGALHRLSGGAVWQLGQGETDDGAAIPWAATFTSFTETVHERKYPSRLLLRLELAPGAWVEAELARDGGAFQTVWASHDCNALTAVIPIRPGRCDRYTVRLKGEGRCLIRSMAREFALGGVR